MKLWGVLFLILILNTKALAASSPDWKITQAAWTEEHELLFGKFVAQIAEAVEKRQCGTVAKCLQSAANPYFGTDPAGLRYYADCADFPYYLRAYFAWKNGLPFSFGQKVAPRPSAESEVVIRDVRYSPAGNLLLARKDLIALKNKFPNAVDLLNGVLADTISTASYRMSGVEDGAMYTDLYPARISREAVRAGTVIYDPNGHAALIYKVTDEGRIFYVDAHPDNSLTTGMFTPKFSRSNPNQGAGFKNFRPLRLVDATQAADGVFVGGKIIGLNNDQIPQYGIEQFIGTNPDPMGRWKKGTFVFQGQTVSFYDYVRLTLTLGDQHLHPVEDLKSLLADLCSSLKDRVASVEAARSSGLDTKPHPERLPLNIYGSEGEWEAYATPSRDSRLRVAFMDLLNSAKAAVEKSRAHDPSLIYNGENLAKDLLQTYLQEAASCQFSYTNSVGKSIPLNLETLRQRLLLLSFDPYHCIELRWGASQPQELESCPEDSNKRQWYTQEQWLRNQTERRYDIRMDSSLAELNGPRPGMGVAEAPEVDIVSYLNSAAAFFQNQPVQEK